MGVRGYLVDTNHIGDWERAEPVFMNHLNALPPECLVRVSVITLGEIQWSMGITLTTNQQRRDDYEVFVNRELKPFALELTAQTSIYYGEILKRIWQKYPPPASKETEAHLAELGVDINDVWIVAVAFERGLTLVTADKMLVIREVLPEVTFESWK